MVNLDSAQAQEAEHAALPHAFLLPRGLAPRPGSYNIQLTPFLQGKRGVYELDTGGHASIGMFDWGGLHLRSLGARTAPTTELIGIATLARDGPRGLSLLAIAGAPTGPSRDGHHSSWSFLAGLAGHWPGHGWGADALLHYDFSLGHFIPEVSLIRKLTKRCFAVLEGSATIGNRPEIYTLPGIKFALNRSSLIGLGYRFPLTNSRTFDRQIYAQLEWGRRH
ncbi:MAG: hypothetical protein HY549_01475 [Elusimicrobia bacterium]|nr:hypothetical protein [Elusimicrobiota bacterium]